MPEKYTNRDNKIQAVCFTGHREIEKSVAINLPHHIKQAIRETIARGATRFLAGGAVGFDTIAAICVLELRDTEFPHISLELILPCRSQSAKWNEINKMVYCSILDRADRVEYLHESYTSSCMHDRNRRLVDLCDVVFAFCTHSGGGTAYTMGYALKQGREVVNVAEFI